MVDAGQLVGWKQLSVLDGNNRKERQQIKGGDREGWMGQQNIRVNTEGSCSSSASNWQLLLLSSMTHIVSKF